MLERKIGVMVVDDSAVMRHVLTRIINTAPDMYVIATAKDPLIALEKIRLLNPDVVTLDVVMPQMDGIAFLSHLMQVCPRPVLMVSSHTQEGSEAAFRALELGAVDFWPKPVSMKHYSVQEYAESFCDKIRMVAAAKLLPKDSVAQKASGTTSFTLASHEVIAVGASTGGPEALKVLLSHFPKNSPPILIVQHMPPRFTHTLALRLNEHCQITVKEAEDGERLIPGTAYIAPGDFHMGLRTLPDGYAITLTQTEPIHRHRPAVDSLFESVAQQVGRQAVGVILTGMGSDGAAGLLRMRQAGGKTFGQAESSCVVYGMPKEAMKRGAVKKECPLESLAHQILACCSGECASSAHSQSLWLEV